jgi:hypothetical protein
MTVCKIGLVVAVLMSVSVTSQEPFEAELHRRFHGAVTGADATWREESSRMRQGVRDFSSKQWRRGDTLLSLRHYPHQTASEAVQRARRLAEGSSVGFRPIKGFGDEAYLIDSPSSLSSALIIQVGTTVLNVGSRDGNALLKFGTLFVREIEQARREGIVR